MSFSDSINSKRQIVLFGYQHQGKFKPAPRFGRQFVTLLLMINYFITTFKTIIFNFILDYFII